MLLISLLASTAAATPALEQRWLVPRANVTGPAPDDYKCESARASDYYGIGVRLGIYFSWLTAWVAQVWLPDEISSALDQNAVFLFAVC